MAQRHRDRGAALLGLSEGERVGEEAGDLVGGLGLGGELDDESDGDLAARVLPPVSSYRARANGLRLGRAGHARRASGAYDDFDTVCAMRVGLVAVEGCFGAGLVSMLDMLRTADALRAEVDPVDPADRHQDRGRPPARVTTGSGVVLSASAGLADLPGFDPWWIGALGHPGRARRHAGGPGSAATYREPDGGRWRAGRATRRRRWRRRAPAAFALAEAGILDGGRATTSWWLGSGFRCPLPRGQPRPRRHGGHRRAGRHGGRGVRAHRPRPHPVCAGRADRARGAGEPPPWSSTTAPPRAPTWRSTALRARRARWCATSRPTARVHLGAPIEIPRRGPGDRHKPADPGAPGAQTLWACRPSPSCSGCGWSAPSTSCAPPARASDQIAPRVGYANGSTLRALMRRSRTPGR